MARYSWLLFMTFSLQHIILLTNAEDGYRYRTPHIQLTYPTNKVEVRDQTVDCRHLVTERPTKPLVPERIVERVEFIPEEHLKRDQIMRATIEDQKGQINDQVKELDNQREQINTQREVITERVEDIRLKDRTIDDLNNRIDDQVKELDKQREQINTQREVITERVEEIRLKDRTIGDLNNRIDDQRLRLDNQDRELKQHKDDLRNRDREIEKRDIVIENQKTRITEQINTLDNRDRVIREQKDTITDRDRDIEDRDRTINTHLETIDMLVEELRRLRGAPNLGVVLGDKIIEFIEMEKQKVRTTGVSGGVEITQRRTQQRVTTSGGGGGFTEDGPGSRGNSFRESSRSSFSSSSGSSSGSGGSRGNTDNEDELNFNSVGGGLEFPSGSGSSRSTSTIPLIPLGGFSGSSSSSSRKSETRIASGTASRPSILYGPPKNLESSASTSSFKTVSYLKEKDRGGLRSSRNSRVNRHATIPQTPPRRPPPTVIPDRKISSGGSTRLIRTNGYRSYLIVPSG